MYICFRKRLWSKLKATGVSGALVGVLEAMYTGDCMAIDVNGDLGGLISLSRGVKQGCPLSPLLFNIFIADLGEALDKTSGIKLGSTNISGRLI